MHKIAKDPFARKTIALKYYVQNITIVLFSFVCTFKWKQYESYVGNFKTEAKESLNKYVQEH